MQESLFYLQIHVNPMYILQIITYTKFTQDLCQLLFNVEIDTSYFVFVPYNKVDTIVYMLIIYTHI
jgi:hypothetical protein